jgi:hypothetical protein
VATTVTCTKAAAFKPADALHFSSLEVQSQCLVVSACAMDAFALKQPSCCWAMHIKATWCCRIHITRRHNMLYMTMPIGAHLLSLPLMLASSGRQDSVQCGDLLSHLCFHASHTSHVHMQYHLGVELTHFFTHSLRSMMQ